VPEQAFLPARHAIGPADARYVIREFSDLQCPFCARFAEQVFPAIEATLLARGDVRFEYHHLVLGGRFANSGLAAEATECVADANPDDATAFWTYLDALFERQQAWSALGGSRAVLRPPPPRGRPERRGRRRLPRRQDPPRGGAGVDRARRRARCGRHPDRVRRALPAARLHRIESYLEAMARIDAFSAEAAATADD
jgi:hypothetical protein